MPKVFIDGSAGTTGLQIFSRLQKRTDIELILIDEDKRKNNQERAFLMNKSDVVFLCLPDSAAQEAIGLITNTNVCIIDTSTAHRCNDDWTYGFPEIGFRDKISKSKRIANPGCHATGFISIAKPLILSNLLKSDAILASFSLTGYSGGGKQMIAKYESEKMDTCLFSPSIYATTQLHKHIPEILKICELKSAPVFCPVVDDYYKGMATTILFHKEQFVDSFGMSKVHSVLSDFYSDSKLVKVLNLSDVPLNIYANAKSGLDSLDLIVAGQEDRFTITALFDNLGKGASGAAIQNMNIVFGFEETLGLVI